MLLPALRLSPPLVPADTLNAGRLMTDCTRSSMARQLDVVALTRRPGTPTIGLRSEQTRLGLPARRVAALG